MGQPRDGPYGGLRQGPGGPGPRDPREDPRGPPRYDPREDLRGDPRDEMYRGPP